MAESVVPEKVAQELMEALYQGDDSAAATATRAALAAGVDPLALIQDVIVPALTEVGRRFENLEAFLPELIAAGEAGRVCSELIEDAVVQSGSQVQTRGVIILAAQRAGVEICEYTPLQVKQAVVGNGRATKDQVEYMVRALLGIKEKLPSSHAADALAMALCYLQSSGLASLIDGRPR